MPQIRLRSVLLALPSGRSLVDKILFLLLALTIVGVIGAVIYIATLPQRGETFTEFYILGSQSKAADYPTDLILGEEGEIVLVIVNREQRIVNYNVEVTINDTMYERIGPVILEHRQKWEKPISFRPTNRGNNQKVEFILYKNGQSTSPESLYLWIDVK